MKHHHTALVLVTETLAALAVICGILFLVLVLV